MNFQNYRFRTISITDLQKAFLSLKHFIFSKYRFPQDVLKKIFFHRLTKGVLFPYFDQNVTLETVARPVLSSKHWHSSNGGLKEKGLKFLKCDKTISIITYDFKNTYK